MSKPRLRAGLIGVGAMGRHHARVLKALDGVDLIAAADPGGDPYGVLADVPLLPDVQSLIALNPDYAVVVCPTAQHEPVALQLAEAGIPALIEKPLAHDTPAAHCVVEAFESRGLVAAVGHIERYNPALQSMRTRLEAGELGDVFQVATRRQGPFPNRIADVGVVKDLATHDLDLTGWVTGTKYTSVAAKTAHRSGRPHEDLVTVLGELDSGVIANHLVNWLSPLKERVSIVTGEKGCFVADTLTADLTFFANGSTRTEWDAISVFRGVSEGDMTRYAIPKREPLVLEHETFRDAVEGKTDAGIVTLRQGLRAVMVAEAVLDSARTGATLPLTLP
ncbi:Gfo/Idh/MocA family oxidoreductase [Actinospica sp.]|uniref:Gfo/Idh/MocA family protein n=1 Tax=Actinospica sp. TaxID=1872142 RepID=UPI002BBBC14C|nr:Gfo/Idh/MocA family oxidoreductase [Actinospica sp.]HWG23937.1 Gfo/Idh/MocA family oxidoreductase [Actinospica sp.]